MNKKILAIALTMIGLTAGAFTAAAHPEPANEPESGLSEEGGHDASMTAEPGHFAFAHRLDLTADQMEKIKTERLKTEKQLIQDMADMQKMHLDLRAEATQDKPDMDKLEKLTRQMGEQHAKIIMEHTKSMIFFRSLLTPEQKKKFDTMSTHMGGFGEGRHRMGRKGAGKQEKQCESK